MVSRSSVRGRDSKEAQRRQNRVGGVVWGLVLMGLGAMFVLDSMGRFDAGRIWDWWPLALVGIGATNLIAPRGDGDLAWGVAFFAGGAYFLAREFDWIDWRFRQVWPFLLVLAGVALVLRALAARRPEEAPTSDGQLPENGGVR
jgi:hypothetical protein